MIVKRALKRYSAPYLALWVMRLGFHRLTRSLRTLPDFLIIGAQRSGTTSLYNYLCEHPAIAPALRKEIHFFDNNFKKGLPWYRSYFPLNLEKRRALQDRGQGLLSGESTPYYLFHPTVPARVFASLPKVKLIALLRNPIDRAYSHYQHEVNLGVEKAAFEDAIRKEKEALASEEQRLGTEKGYQSFAYQNYSYLSRGIYVDQIKAWRKYFNQESLLILKSEDFYANPRQAMKQVFSFLALPAREAVTYRRYNEARYPPMSTDTRRILAHFFEPHNQNLYEYLGINFDW